MKIKVAMLVQDPNYLTRIEKAFNTFYPDKTETYCFTNKDTALAALDGNRADILIAEESYGIDPTSLPGRCGFAYFTDAQNVEEINGKPAIFRFQQVDLIYKSILSVYAEFSSAAGGGIGDASTPIIAFSSPCGGTGTSTVAAACAMHFAALGKRCLYLNLEQFGSAEQVFSGQGQFSLTDIIYAIKSRKGNLSMKLESCVKQDRSGVFYFAPATLTLDLMELTREELSHLLKALQISGNYDLIVLDMDFSLGRDTLELLRTAKTLIWVSDGSDAANDKLCRAYASLSVAESNSAASLIQRLQVFYNRFQPNSIYHKRLAAIEIRELGSAPDYRNASSLQAAGELSRLACFNQVV